MILASSVDSCRNGVVAVGAELFGEVAGVTSAFSDGGGGVQSWAQTLEGNFTAA